MQIQIGTRPGEHAVLVRELIDALSAQPLDAEIELAIDRAVDGKMVSHAHNGGLQLEFDAKDRVVQINNFHCHDYAHSN